MMNRRGQAGVIPAQDGSTGSPRKMADSFKLLLACCTTKAKLVYGTTVRSTETGYAAQPGRYAELSYLWVRYTCSGVPYLAVRTCDCSGRPRSRLGARTGYQTTRRTAPPSGTAISIALIR